MMMKHDKTYPQEMWWHHHPVFQLDEDGKASPRPGQEAEFKKVWRKMERAAWTYELVRRLESMLQNNWPRKGPIPPKEVLRTFAQLPPFNQLTSTWMSSVRRCCNIVLGIGPIALENTPPILSNEGKVLLSHNSPGYGLFPSVRFNLTASDEMLVEFFLERINYLRAASDIPPRPQMKRIPHLYVKWRNLDYAHDPSKFKCPQQNESRCRIDLVRTACDHVKSVAAGVIAALEQEHNVAPEISLSQWDAIDEWEREHCEGDGKTTFVDAELAAMLISVHYSHVRITKQLTD